MYLAIDQGGHATRAVIFGENGSRISYVVVPVSEERSGRRRVEQDPLEIVASIRAAVGLAVRKAGGRPDRIRAAGLATQRSGVVCWSRSTGEPLSPMISWQDRRCADDLDRLAGKSKAIRDKTGMFLSPHYGAGKIRWCIDNMPRIRKAHRAGDLVCGPLASFIASNLLVEHPLVADPANAGRTLLWNRHTLDWDPELLEWFGIGEDCLPRCTPTRHQFGSIPAGNRAIPLEIVTGDQNAAVYSAGRPDDRTLYVNIGTGAFALRVFRRDPGTAPGLLSGMGRVDGRVREHVLEGTVNGAASALLWLENRYSVRDLWHMLPSWLDGEVEPPLFLNGISGLGAPWWVPDFESRFIGDGEPPLLAAAVVESIVFLLRRVLSSMEGIGPPVRRISISGGLSLLDGLCRRMADLSSLPVVRFPSHEATARGAACLAASIPGGWKQKPESGNRFKPRTDRPLLDRYGRWLAEMESTVKGSTAST